jgi:DNA excision repair protein ERCC-4
VECGRPRVYVDVRERGSGVPEALHEMGAAVVYQQLGVGDYLVSDRVVFERKTVADLVSSVFDGRLFDQARRMREYYERPVVLVEGSLEELARYTSRVVEVKMALLTLSLDHGVAVVFASDPGEAARIVYHAACREQYSERRPIVVHRKPRLESLWMQQLYVVQSLPGVGPRLAEKLLSYFGSIEAICRASVVELERVLGESRARAVYRVLHTPYRGPRG